MCTSKAFTHIDYIPIKQKSIFVPFFHSGYVPIEFLSVPTPSWRLNEEVLTSRPICVKRKVLLPLFLKFSQGEALTPLPSLHKGGGVFCGLAKDYDSCAHIDREGEIDGE